MADDVDWEGLGSDDLWISYPVTDGIRLIPDENTPLLGPEEDDRESILGRMRKYAVEDGCQFVHIRNDTCPKSGLC